MAFKMNGFSAFTKKEKTGYTPQTQDKSGRTATDYIPQTQLHKLDSGEIEGYIDAMYENEYSEAVDDGDTSKVKLLMGRMKKYKKELESRGEKYTNYDIK